MLNTQKRTFSIIMISALIFSLALLSFRSAEGVAQTDQPASPETKPTERAVDRRVLQKGESHERSLTVGEAHSYEMKLSADQYVSMVLERYGVAAVATLFGPDDQKIGIFGSSSSRQGQEPITFVAGTSGIYRIEVRTYFKPTPPGRYKVKLADLRTSTAQDRMRLAVQTCEEKRWVDGENNFLVDLMLNSISECMSAVGLKLGSRYPQAAGIATDTSAEIAFLTSRWHWGESVSAAYQEGLILDFNMLSSAAKERDEKRAYAIMREVADDIRIKADHCRNSTRGLGADVTISIETRKGNSQDPGWQVYYKLRIYEFSKGHTPERFPLPSSPTSYVLPPGKYLIWAEKPMKAQSLRSKEELIRVGEGKQQLEWVLFVPDQ
jgi:hypothetical protein